MNEVVDAMPKPPRPQNVPEEVPQSATVEVEEIDKTTSPAEDDSEEKVTESTEVKLMESSTPPQSQQQPQEDTVKDVVEESNEQSLPSPPRKSARLSAKRRDSATDSDASITRCESPIPRRRSLRRNSISVQDSTPAKTKDESKKLPVITEVDGSAKSPKTKTTENETQQSEKALVDELASAFVEEFIDDEE